MQTIQPSRAGATAPADETEMTDQALPGAPILRQFPDRVRGRSARALANDEALRDAALDIVVESGWEQLSLQNVASRAGLTVGAIYARAENKSELGIDLWRARCLPVLTESLEALAPQLVTPLPTYRAALPEWFEPAAELAAALELLVSARYDADLGDVLLDDVALMTKPLRDALRTAPAEARARLDLALGATFIALGGDRIPVPAAPPLERALSERDPILAPILVVGVPDDPEATAMLDAAREVLVRVGHRRATAARIARAAGVMTSTLFARFPTKALLFAASIGGREIRGALAIELERLGRVEPALTRWSEAATPAARVHLIGSGLSELLLGE